MYDGSDDKISYWTSRLLAKDSNNLFLQYIEIGAALSITYLARQQQTIRDKKQYNQT